MNPTIDDYEADLTALFQWHGDVLNKIVGGDQEGHDRCVFTHRRASVALAEFHEVLKSFYGLE